MSANALMIDYEFCTGCHACEVACKKHLEVGEGQYGIHVLQDGPRELPDGRWEYNFLPMPTSLCDMCAGRIAEGKELKVDFLWNKEAELERTGWEEEE